jgi:NTE family protein
MNKRLRGIVNFYGFLLMALFYATGCAHYPINKPLEQVDVTTGYRGAYMKSPGSSDSLLVYLTFSGGGTRAAAFSYGVLEELRKTEVTIDGNKRRLLDEIDGISSVSGGSFTAGYYGLFGDRIFDEFEDRFLKKNVQGALTARIFLNPINWFRLASPYLDRSDLAAEYYDKHVFEWGTFGDIAARKGPLILMNATEMTYGIRVGFVQDSFDMICSDLSVFPVSRAATASSAVPMLFSPVTLYNYAGTCGFEIPEKFAALQKGRAITERQFYLSNNIEPFLDSKKKPYIHLVDGGIADNLGLRAVLERVVAGDGVWELMKGTSKEKTNKVLFIVVNAETETDSTWDTIKRIPPLGAVLSSYTHISIERYNEETIALLKESVKSWADEIKTKRCGGGPVSTEPGSCGDIEFYVVDVKFDLLEDEKERRYFKKLPTSFKLEPEQVDNLRDVAQRILNKSPEFQRFLNDLK